MKRYSENQLRTIFKVVSWRIILTISHIVNAFIVTGSIITGLKIAGLATVINSVLYWVHERIWNWIQWNRRSADQSKFVEGNPRSLGKMISWRVLITVSNFLIPFILTGSWGSAVLFAGMATFVNMFIFWSHERIWNRIRYGKTVNEL